MKKYPLAFLIFLLLIFHIFTIPVVAEPKTLNEGFYKAPDLNLSHAFILYKILQPVIMPLLLFSIQIK